jgi:hypothetical protein
MSHLDLLNQFFKFILLCTAVYAFVVLLKTENKKRLDKLLLACTIFSIFDILSNYILIAFLKSQSLFDSFATVNQYIFYAIEIITIIHFYNLIILKKSYWKTTLAIALVSIISTILFLEFSDIKTSFITFSLIIIFELIFINFSFGYFFVTNLEKPYIQKINNLIIINYGYFVFVNFTAPFYFITVFISKQNAQTYDLSFLNYIGYLILYLSFIISRKWKN